MNTACSINYFVFKSQIRCFLWFCNLVIILIVTSWKEFVLHFDYFVILPTQFDFLYKKLKYYQNLKAKCHNKALKIEVRQIKVRSYLSSKDIYIIFMSH